MSSDGIAAMRWIDRKDYLGLDRRKQRAVLRFRERRLNGPADDAPSLGAALRQLRVHAAAADTRKGVESFLARTRAVAELADAYKEPELAKALLQLAALAAASADEDWCARLELALSRMSGRFDTIG